MAVGNHPRSPATTPDSRARIAEVKKIWSAWLHWAQELNVVLIDAVSAARDPAVSARRAAN